MHAHRLKHPYLPETIIGGKGLTLEKSIELYEKLIAKGYDNLRPVYEKAKIKLEQRQNKSEGFTILGILLLVANGTILIYWLLLRLTNRENNVSPTETN